MTQQQALPQAQHERYDDHKWLLCRVRQGGGDRQRQSQDVQVVYDRQVLRRCVSKEALGNAQKAMQTTCRRAT